MYANSLFSSQNVFGFSSSFFSSVTGEVCASRNGAATGASSVGDRGGGVWATAGAAAATAAINPAASPRPMVVVIESSPVGSRIAARLAHDVSCEAGATVQPLPDAPDLTSLAALAQRSASRSGRFASRLCWPDQRG